MGQPGMRITVDAAMRARDVSRPRQDGAEAATPRPAASTDHSETGKRGKAAKNERRRLDKRGGRKPPQAEPR
ncbi:hypothetical protein [Actinomadura sp. NBRC 104412]|uniref:hypothetical protein n=1 Tax=Actinomadura sp. NBRC 104412 TaxID=3032203 RepID=UPI0025571E80|nr:hypothetical protein [Actinomadura sp. NBRC 104412]